MDLSSTFRLMASKMHRPSHGYKTLSSVDEPPKWCGFLAIARELRDMIYPELIASGNTAILRVSKQVHDEAKDHLYEHGICRLRYYSYSGLLDVLGPAKLPPSNVKTFDLKIHLDGQKSDVRSLDWLRRLDLGWRLLVKGSGSCNVTLIFDHDEGNYMPIVVLILVKCLGNFELVTVRAHFRSVYHNMDRRNRDRIKPVHETLLEKMSEDFGMTLGDPEWKPEPHHRLLFDIMPWPPINPCANARYLEFHPPGARTSDSKPGPSVLRVSRSLWNWLKTART